MRVAAIESLGPASDACKIVAMALHLRTKLTSAGFFGPYAITVGFGVDLDQTYFTAGASCPRHTVYERLLRCEHVREVNSHATMPHYNIEVSQQCE